MKKVGCFLFIYALLLFITPLFTNTVYWIVDHQKTPILINLNQPINQYSPREQLVFSCKQAGIKLIYLQVSFVKDNLQYCKELFGAQTTKYIVIEGSIIENNKLEILFSMIPFYKRVLLPWEPPTVTPFLYTKKLLSKYHKVFTWNNDLVDGKKFLKIYHKVRQPLIPNRPAFKAKKLCCMVFAYKQSNYPLELYSLRRQIVRYFGDKSGEFDLYGVGWPLSTPNYHGIAHSKRAVIKNYKFCFAMENTRDISGYMTEKMWDAFSAGVIPIYLGDREVGKEIPSACFIDMRNFSDLDALLSYVKSMPEEEYEARIQAITDFLASDTAKKYTTKNFVKSVTQYLLQ